MPSLLLTFPQPSRDGVGRASDDMVAMVEGWSGVERGGRYMVGLR